VGPPAKPLSIVATRLSPKVEASPKEPRLVKSAPTIVAVRVTLTEPGAEGSSEGYQTLVGRLAEPAPGTSASAVVQVGGTCSSKWGRRSTVKVLSCRIWAEAEGGEARPSEAAVTEAAEAKSTPRREGAGEEVEEEEEVEVEVAVGEASTSSPASQFDALLAAFARAEAAAIPRAVLRGAAAEGDARGVAEQRLRAADLIVEEGGGS